MGGFKPKKIMLNKFKLIIFDKEKEKEVFNGVLSFLIKRALKIGFFPIELKNYSIKIRYDKNV